MEKAVCYAYYIITVCNLQAYYTASLPYNN